MLALSDEVSITFSIVGAVVLIALFVVLRLVLRREPSPISWRRFRMGIFIERDPKDERDRD